MHLAFPDMAQPRTPQKRAADACKESVDLVSSLKHTETLMMAANWVVTGEFNMASFKSKAGAVLDSIRKSITLATHVKMEFAGAVSDLKREIATLRRARDDALHKVTEANSKISNYEQSMTEAKDKLTDYEQKITDFELRINAANDKLKDYEQLLALQLSAAFTDEEEEDDPEVKKVKLSSPDTEKTDNLDAGKGENKGNSKAEGDEMKGNGGTDKAGEKDNYPSD